MSAPAGANADIFIEKEALFVEHREKDDEFPVDALQPTVPLQSARADMMMGPTAGIRTEDLIDMGVVEPHDRTWVLGQDTLGLARHRCGFRPVRPNRP